MAKALRKVKTWNLRKQIDGTRKQLWGSPDPVRQIYYLFADTWILAVNSMITMLQLGKLQRLGIE